MHWKVSQQHIKLFPHPNADKLEIGRVGDYPVVVQKGLYNDGDVVVFAPEKSVLTGEIRQEFEKYLKGTNHDCVHSVRLRGELSCGIIIPPHLLPDLQVHSIGEDVSALLGITKYVPQIPDELKGEAEETPTPTYKKHDVLHFSVYEADFVPGERVVVTEKINGSQCTCVLQPDGKRSVMSKGLADEGVSFKPDGDNVYLRAVRTSRIFEKLQEFLDKGHDDDSVLGKRIAYQVFGEVVPCVPGWSYGLQNEARFIAFRFVVIAENVVVEIPYTHPNNVFRDDWVPVLYDGAFRDKVLAERDGELTFRQLVGKLCTGTETLTGRQTKIREGCVVTPYIMRRASDGNHLVVKVINPDYRETGEEFS